MSADNGIYILESDGPEYRVAYACAIENINWNPITKSDSDINYFNDEELQKYFGKCEVFTKKKLAMEEAYSLGRQFPPYLEYGICRIRLPRKFPTNTTFNLEQVFELGQNVNLTINKDTGAQNLAGHLVWLSTPFQVEPLPDGKFLFTIKSEIYDRVLEFCCEGHIEHSPCGCNCHYGGFDETGVCKQPCNNCNCQE